MCVERGSSVLVPDLVFRCHSPSSSSPRKPKMPFASDKLYSGYLRTNMPTIVSKVKVRQIMVHLPCLTDYDRETIEAKREISGNFNGMVLLLDCLKRRDSWPEHFIRALEMCEHGNLAAEIRAEYDKLRGGSDSPPSSPPTSVVKAHIHPAPSPPQLARPESSSPSRAAACPPSPPQSDAEAQLQTPAPPPLSEPPLASSAPEATPPPSPPQEAERPDPDHPQPEESSESDVGSAQAIPEEVLFSYDAPPAESCETDVYDVIESPPESPVDLDVTDTHSTPEKPPVQETALSVETLTPAAAVFPPPEDISEAPATQIVVENCTATGSPPASPVLPEVSSLVCPSPPRTLASILPPEDSSSDAAYSGDTDRLQISKDEEVRVNVVHVSQQPCALNLDGRRVVNGDAAKEAASVQEPLCPEPDKPAPRAALGANAKFMVTAVGVGACALLVAWKLKH